MFFNEKLSAHQKETSKHGKNNCSHKLQMQQLCKTEASSLSAWNFHAKVARWHIFAAQASS